MFITWSCSFKRFLYSESPFKITLWWRRYMHYLDTNKSCLCPVLWSFWAANSFEGMLFFMSTCLIHVLWIRRTLSISLSCLAFSKGSSCWFHVWFMLPENRKMAASTRLTDFKHCALSSIKRHLFASSLLIV